MDILLILFGFILVCLVVFLYNIRLLIIQRNKIHFYVARDKSGMLYFYPTKPIRRIDCFIPNYDKNIYFTSKEFTTIDCFNIKKFDNLKWEDEPVEVFVNRKD